MAIIKVKTGGITADAITDALIADDVVGTEHLTANEVDTTALGADAVTGAQLADNAVNSEHYTDGSIDTAHIADAQITTAKLSTAVLTGATDIGAAIADADLFLIDDGAGGTLRKTAASRIKTYIGGATATAEFSAYMSSDQAINDNTNTALIFQTEVFDTDGVYNTSNGRFTAPSDGKYFLSTSCWTYDGSAKIKDQNIMFYINGSMKYRQEFIADAALFQKFDSQLTAILDLDANDYVQVYIYANTTDNSALAVEASGSIFQNVFSGFRLPT